MVVLSTAAFFASGFAALLYQVIWQRLLVIFSGADLYSVTIIVAAFMGGLGAGHLVGGHVADRTSPRTGLILFGVAELAIAVFGFFSSALYYGFLYRRLGDVPIPSPVMAGMLFLSLLWPTFFMGASLPLLARALAHRIEKAASIIGLLYGVNTLGAAAGSILSTWVLIPRLGLESSLRIGVALNVTCAAMLVPAIFMFKKSQPLESALPPTTKDAKNTKDSLGFVNFVTSVVRSSTRTSGEDAPADTAGAAFGFGLWAGVSALSGLLALSLEIVWFRLLSVMMKSTAFTFGTLLGVYLTGIGLGALAGAAIARRTRRPAVAFLGLQSAVGLTAMFLLTVFIRRVDNTSLLWTYLGTYEPVDVRDSVNWLAAFAGGSLSADAAAAGPPWAFLVSYFGVPLLLVLPPTLLMGCSFPMLQRVVQTKLSRIGRRVGILLLANVLGSMAGTILTGWVLLDWLGTAWTMRLLAATSSLFALFGFWLLRAEQTPDRRAPAAIRALLATAVVFVPLLAVMPPSETLWAHMHGTIAEQIVFGEDGSGLSVIKTDSRRAVVFVNGIGQSTMPYGDLHTALGALPAFIHPAPRTAAVIGLGSGDTVHAVAGRRDIERVTCVEIIRGQIQTLEALHERLPYGGLTTLLADPRIHQVFGDGRIYLQRGRSQYDIIEADALRPSSAYSGNLYSDAYFALVRDHLTPHGLAATWAPTQRVYNTFLRAFPHVVAVTGILLGSKQPIVIDRPAIMARLADAGTREHFVAAEIDIAQLMARFLADPVTYGPEFPRVSLTDVNTDLFPKDEFDLSPRSR